MPGLKVAIGRRKSLVPLRIMITPEQRDYLRRESRTVGYSEGFIVRNILQTTINRQHKEESK